MKGLGIVLWALLLCLLVAPPMIWVMIAAIVGAIIYGIIVVIKKGNKNQ